MTTSLSLKHIVVQNPNLSELYFVNSFLSGLKDKISSTLYLHKPVNLKNERDKVRAQEVVIKAMEKRNKATTRSVSSSAMFTRKESAPFVDRAKTTRYQKIRMDTKPVRRLSYNDFKERMSKGLCVHCDGKYTPGHNCRNK